MQKPELKHIMNNCSLGYEDCIPDGFYEAFGDFPELVDPGELPTLAALKHAQLIEGDLREVSPIAVKDGMLFPHCSRSGDATVHLLVCL